MKKNFIISLLFLMFAGIFALIGAGKEYTFFALGIIGFFGLKKFVPAKFKTLFILSAMTLLMFCNFTKNIFNRNNDEFKRFQWGLELLITEKIDARQSGVTDMTAYGLGFFNSDKKIIEPYTSQYGLQGKIFQKFNKIQNLHCVCALLTAIVLSLISFLLSKKYNRLFAFCFFIIFLFSPFIVNYSRNLYFVEFTWFVPMLMGLFVSLNYNRKINPLLETFGVFVAVLIKSLCGYEYVSVILLAMIAFPLVDFIESVFEKDWKKSAQIFRNVFLMGIFALFGFVVAILIHANLRGNGNLLDGVKSIYEKDVLRRTFGGKVENFDPILKNSIQASVLRVLKKYYGTHVELIVGISSQLFTLISLLPLLIFSKNAFKKNLNKKDVILYFILYMTCISWFVLGKSHSYEHVHMNYVLWYFGFVQICFYVILKQIIEWLKMIARYVLENRETLKKSLLGKIYD